MSADMVPRTPGYVSVGSRRYNEWQTLAFEATTDRKEEPPEEYTGPLVDHPQYPTPTKILFNPRKKIEGKTENIKKIASRSEEERYSKGKGQDEVLNKSLGGMEELQDPPVAINVVKKEGGVDERKTARIKRSVSNDDRDRRKKANRS